ncbi:MAG: hypothetical protein ACOWWR_09735 [Eubacteriales bacterium]
MKVNKKTLEKLRDLINEETEYRSGPKLVDFFNDLGSNDVYGSEFPSRWKYTDDRLNSINGTSVLDDCIKKLFNPVNFIGQISKLDKHILDFNQYLAYDKWQVVRIETEITFRKAGKIKLYDNKKLDLSEDKFLDKEFNDIALDDLLLNGIITETLKSRFEEIKRCFSAKAHLSVIFMAGSTLEGILLGTALDNPKEFNQARISPKDRNGKVKPFYEWTLSQFIDVASEIGLLKEDVRKFSHALRDFRNYIHPYQQVSSKFYPDEHTAKICLQVLKAAIYQITRKNRNKDYKLLR